MPVYFFHKGGFLDFAFHKSSDRRVKRLKRGGIVSELIAEAL